MNGTEYFYIRNAKIDIIGILDATGTQVVKNTYDSWGKVISTTGTKATTVGKLNPYRYRGYRYDEETGFYYLQSRYYNPEWGRFINADGLTSTGQGVIGNNMFAYCLNNPVNMSDEYGCMPRGHYGVDTAVSGKKPGPGNCAEHTGPSQPIPKPPTPNKSKGDSGFNEVLPTQSQAQGIGKGAFIGWLDGGISQVLDEIPEQYVYYANRAARRAGTGLIIEVEGASLAKAIGKVGVVGTICTGIQVWDNFHSGYSQSEAWGRSGIDMIATCLAITIGVVTPAGWAIAIGLGIGLVAEVAKNYYYGGEN